MFRTISDYSKLVDSQCSDRVCNNPIKQFDAKPFHSDAQLQKSQYLHVQFELSIIGSVYSICSLQYCYAQGRFLALLGGGVSKEFDLFQVFFQQHSPSNVCHFSEEGSNRPHT